MSSARHEVLVDAHFSAAHRLREYKGECERLHGHNWKVEVQLRSAELNGLGMVIDFRDVKKILSEVMRRFDHAYLNELPEFSEMNPTTENLAMVIYKKLSEKVPAGVKVSKLTAWESDGCGASYSE